jgi:hypothetical protein
MLRVSSCLEAFRRLHAGAGTSVHQLAQRWGVAKVEDFELDLDWQLPEACEKPQCFWR